MRGLRTPWIRGALTLGVLAMFGAGMLVSNVGAVAERREASKKFVKKRIAKAGTQITNQVTNQIRNTTIGEDELIRYSIQTDVTGDDTTIATIGNFTFTANCELDGDNTIVGQVLITTNADDAGYVSDQDDDVDLDTADSGEVWVGGDSGALVGDAQGYYSFADEGQAVGPTGTTVQGTGGFWHNVGGNDCTLSGFLLQTNV